MSKLLAIANRIINRTNAYNEYRAENGLKRIHMDGKRLQKILYLCQLFWDASYDEEFVLEDFVAWANGPAASEIYNYFLVYQEGDMHPYLNVEYKLSQEERELINKVVDNTIEIPTETIIDFSHDEVWEQYFKGGLDKRIIPKKKIRKYAQENSEKLLNFVKNN